MGEVTLAPDFVILLRAAGCNDNNLNYFKARGILNAPMLAMMGKTEDMVMTRVVQQFIDGCKIGEVEFKATDPFVAESAILHAWKQCKNAYELANSAVQTQIAQQLVATAAPTNTVSATATTVATKIPKELPPGVWLQQIAAWNLIHIGDQFVTEQLLGAETVLARIWYEHTVSKQYTPVKLGEILQLRTWTATGAINQLANADRRSQKLTFDEGSLMNEKELDWTPLSQFSMLDAIESIRWAWMFCGMIDKNMSMKWTNFFAQYIRDEAALGPQIRRLWETASWKIALAMRGGETMTDAMNKFLADIYGINKILSTHIEAPRDLKRRRDKGNGKGGARPITPPRTRIRGNNWETPKSTWTPPAKDLGSPTADRTGKEPCNRFNLGKCNATNCKFDHRCNVCNKPGHTAVDCWAAPGNEKPSKGKGKGKGKGKSTSSAGKRR